DNARIVVWRTAVNGSTLFRDSALNNSTSNPYGTQSTTYTITQADSAVTGNEQLYTSGALANIGPPAARFPVSHQNRLFLMGMEDPGLIWFSRKYVKGAGINFSDVLTMRVDAPGGDISGGASLDDKLIVFKQTATYAVFGDGPDNLGN